MDLRAEITKRSIKKKKKYSLTRGKIIGDRVLELGCSAAGLSRLLLKGKWVGLDLDEKVVREYHRYLGTPAVVAREKLPFRNNSFSTVLMFDFLEHVEEDRELFSEAVRVLRSDGRLIITTPRAGKLFMIKFRNFIGLKKEAYGHKREGYTVEELKTMAEGEGLKIEEVRLYSGFFLEFLEALQNWVYFKMSKVKRDRRSGSISPVEEDEFKKMKKLLFFYRLAYPFFLAADFLDRILGTKKHVIFLMGRKP